MSVFKNATEQPLKLKLDGPVEKPKGWKPKKGKAEPGVTVVQPGELLTLSDSQDYLVGLLTGPGQLVKVNINGDAVTEASEADEDEEDDEDEE